MCGSHNGGGVSMLKERTEALLPVYVQFPVRPVRGRGSWLIDENGDRWLDAYGGHAVAATGHSHPDVVEGTAETYGSTPNTSGRVYAFSAKGKRLPGWAKRCDFPDGS